MESQNAVIRLGGLSALLDDIDEWCGTKPPRKPPPKANALRDLLLAAAIHNLAGQISEERSGKREEILKATEVLYTDAGRRIAGPA